MGENSLRTSLSAYPPNYGSGQYPPLYFSPIAADAPIRLKKNHCHEHPELLSKEMRCDKKKKHRKKKKK